MNHEVVSPRESFELKQALMIDFRNWTKADLLKDLHAAYRDIYKVDKFTAEGISTRISAILLVLQEKKARQAIE